MELHGASSGGEGTKTYIKGDFKLDAITDSSGTYYNLYKASESTSGHLTESLNYQLRDIVAGWYNILRILA